MASNMPIHSILLGRTAGVRKTSILSEALGSARESRDYVKHDIRDRRHDDALHRERNHTVQRMSPPADGAYGCICNLSQSGLSLTAREDLQAPVAPTTPNIAKLSKDKFESKRRVTVSFSPDRAQSLSRSDLHVV